MNYISCDKPGFLSLHNGTPPSLVEGSVSLKVRRVGICGTDLHAFKGTQPFFTYPRILGHELAAEIIEPHNLTAGLQLGDHVAIIPYINCGECVACRAGKSNCCKNIKVVGVHTDGGMQEMISLPARLLIPANDLTLDEIAMVEPLAIGAHALRRANTKKGDTIVVMGCGPIGIGIVQLAKYIGARVIVTDINEHRLKVAKESFDADLIVNALHHPINEVSTFTKGTLAHTVFDATGNKQAIESGIEYMQHGGSFVLVGLYKGELTFSHPAIHARETTLMCSRNATAEDFQFVMKVLREKRCNTQAYITSKVAYPNILTDFDRWASPESKEIKVITVWD